MDSKTKKTIVEWGFKSLWLLLSSGGIVTTLWMIISPHIDSYLEEKMHEYHEHGEVIHVGIIIRDNREWYIGPDGKEHTVIYGDGQSRWWYDGDEMKKIYN